jgi:hypothetical protein
MVWVEFGCPGHGKGPWDGLGTMVKTKVTLDIMHGKEHTMTGNNIAHSSGSTLAIHVLQKGMTHGVRKYTD